MRRFPEWAKTFARRVDVRTRAPDHLAWHFRVRIAALSGWLGVGLIVMLSLVPQSSRPFSGVSGQIEHIVAYALAAMLLLSTCTRKQTGSRILFLCGLAGALELLQLFVPGRTARLIDLSSSIAGVAFGFLVVAIASRERQAVGAPRQNRALTPVPAAPDDAHATSSSRQDGGDLIEWSYRRGWTDRIVDSRPDLLTVLAYHRVTDVTSRHFCGFRPNVSASPDEFERQIAYVCRHASPISVNDLESWLDGGHTLPKRPLLVTFDDGYADNGTIAWPILRASQVPAIVFLATDHIGTGRAFLWDLVAVAIARTRKSSAALPLLGETGLSSAHERELATIVWVDRSKALPPVERWLTLRALLETLEVDLDESEFGHLYLAWNEVQRLASQGLDFGGHTLTHPILAKSSYLDARREIEGSRSKIASILGRAPCAFAYPNGSTHDFHPEHEKLVEDAGYAMAFSLKPGPMTLIGAKFRRMAIRRIYIGQDDGMGRFAAKLAGAARARQTSQAVLGTARALLRGNSTPQRVSGLGHAISVPRS